MPRQLVALDCDRGSIRRLGFQAHASTAHARRHAQHTRTSVDRAGLAGWGQSCWRWEWRARRNPQKNRRCYFFGCTARLTTRKYWKPPQPMYIKRSFPPGPPSAKPVPHAGGGGGGILPTQAHLPALLVERLHSRALPRAGAGGSKWYPPESNVPGHTDGGHLPRRRSNPPLLPPGVRPPNGQTHPRATSPFIPAVLFSHAGKSCAGATWRERRALPRV